MTVSVRVASVAVWPMSPPMARSLQRLYRPRISESQVAKGYHWQAVTAQVGSSRWPGPAEGSERRLRPRAIQARGCVRPLGGQVSSQDIWPAQPGLDGLEPCFRTIDRQLRTVAQPRLLLGPNVPEIFLSSSIRRTNRTWAVARPLARGG